MRRLALALAVLALLATPAATQTPGGGSWTSMGSLPFFPTAMHTLPTSKVLFFGGDVQGTPPGPPANSLRTWDPATGQTSTLASTGYDLFCAGHSFLADGRLFLTGGHIANFVGLPNAGTYDAATNTWTRLPDMNAGRWYPTNTTLANGDVLVVSGQIDTTIGVDALPQVFSPGTRTWRNLTGAQLTLDLYPRMHLVPNGRVFNSGPSGTTRYLDTAGTGSWSVVGTRPGGTRDYAPSVMYDTGKIVFIGGGDPPTAATAVIDLTAAAPAWRTVAAMATPRRHHNATLLPDGKVVVTGGTSGSGFNDTSRPVLAAELWDPATERWTTLAGQTVGRFYHSLALLLPDGRVMSAGGNGRPQVEVFSPPYLSGAGRPTITGAPASVDYGQGFAVQTPNGAAITQVTWIRLPSVTHAFDQNQRFNRLAFIPATGGLTVTAPSSANVAPPGHYMLFILDGQDVPSVARIVRLGGTGGGTPPPVSAPVLNALSPGSAAAGSGAFTLTVTGSNFVAGSVARWNGATRTTTFVSGTQLRVAVPAADIASAGQSAVTVANPAPNAAVSNAVTFTVGAPGGGGALAVHITQPTAGAGLTGTVWVTVWLGGATGSSNSVTATLGGQTVGTTVSSSAGPISFPIDTRVVADGSRTLTISARDAGGRTGSTSLAVTTKNGISAPPGGPAPPPPPTGTLKVWITQPSSGAAVTGTSWVTLWLDGASGTSNTYTITVAGLAVATTTTSSRGPVTLGWDTTTVPGGAQTLTASARDAAGHTGASSISITVGTGGGPPPSPPPSGGTLQVHLTQPTGNAQVKGTVWVIVWLGGASGASNTYTLSVSGRTVATQTTSSTGPVSLPWVTTTADNGMRTLSVTTRDAGGNTGTSSVAVTVAN